MHRRPVLLALALAALATVYFVTIAAAAKPTKTTVPFSGTYLSPDLPANPAICNFKYLQEFSGTDEVTVFSDGRVQVHEKITVTHTNLDTGKSLTGTDQINITVSTDGSLKLTGVFWHLRDASGKIVVVRAGHIVYDPARNLVKFTPNSGPGFAAVICPALGGAPAP